MGSGTSVITCSHRLPRSRLPRAERQPVCRSAGRLLRPVRADRRRRYRQFVDSSELPDRPRLACRASRNGRRADIGDRQFDGISLRHDLLPGTVVDDQRRSSRGVARGPEEVGTRPSLVLKEDALPFEFKSTARRISGRAHGQMVSWQRYLAVEECTRGQGQCDKREAGSPQAERGPSFRCRRSTASEPTSRRHASRRGTCRGLR